jgi:hypothetical protein
MEKEFPDCAPVPKTDFERETHAVASRQATSVWQFNRQRAVDDEGFKDISEDEHHLIARHWRAGHSTVGNAGCIETYERVQWQCQSIADAIVAERRSAGAGRHANDQDTTIYPTRHC